MPQATPLYTFLLRIAVIRHRRRDFGDFHRSWGFNDHLEVEGIVHKKDVELLLFW